MIRTVQWTGNNEAEVQELAVNFEALTEPCGDDPEATASLLTGPHSVWELMLTGDWVVEQRGGGYVRVSDEQFTDNYQETS